MKQWRGSPGCPLSVNSQSTCLNCVKEVAGVGHQYTVLVAPALWFSLLTTSLVISLTPGAGAINTMSNALTVGWRRSIWGVIGLQLAILTHIVIVASGVGLLVSRTPVLFEGIRYLGAAYLLYLGIRLIFSKPTEPAREGDEANTTGGSAWSMLRRGFWVNLLNPKAIVFFLAFLPQFIQTGEPLLPQYAVITLTIVCVDMIVMWFFFAATARPFQRFVTSLRGQKILNTVFGSLFIAVAGLLLLLH